MSNDQVKDRDYLRYYRPLGDRVIVSPVVDGRDLNGLIIPEDSLPPVRKALVMKCGPGTPTYPMPVKATDIVLIPRNKGFKEIRFNDATWILCRSQDLIAIV